VVSRSEIVVVDNESRKTTGLKDLSFNLMTIPFAALKAQKGMKAGGMAQN